jgi:hypothetical protein
VDELTAPEWATYDLPCVAIPEGLDPDAPVLTAPEQNRGLFAGTRSYGSVS